MSRRARVSKVVVEGYDAVAEAYARLEGEEVWPRMRWLRALLARLEPASDVLDLGCGNGVPATEAIARRHRAVGVDISPRHIALARANVLDAEFIEADAALLDFGPERFDAVVSFYMLEHIPRAEHARLLSRAFRWLRPGGYLLMSVEEGEEPGTIRRVAWSADVLQLVRRGHGARHGPRRRLRRGVRADGDAARGRSLGSFSLDPRRKPAATT